VQNKTFFPKYTSVSAKNLFNLRFDDLLFTIYFSIFRLLKTLFRFVLLLNSDFLIIFAAR